MIDSAQRATLVLEHARALREGPENEEEPELPWSVVAYLISDGGQRERATLCRCQTREEAASTMERLWRNLVEQKSRV